MAESEILANPRPGWHICAVNGSQDIFSLRDIGTFVQVVRDGSFTSAGRRLGVTPSAVSKALGRLEDHLGVTLLLRDCRTVTLTPEGSALYERCPTLLAAAAEARDAATMFGTEPAGLLRMSMPLTLGRRLILPSLGKFLESHPKVVPDIIFTNQRLDLVQAGLDLAIWKGELPDSRLVTSKLADLRHVTCASPAFLERHGVPVHPSDVTGHRIGVMSDRNGQLLPWRFRMNGRAVTYSPDCSVILNNLDAALDVALAGIGMVQMLEYQCGAHLAAGRLVPVFAEYALDPLPLRVLYNDHQRHSLKVRAMVAFLQQIFRDGLPGEAANGPQSTEMKTSPSRTVTG